jgi:hypothetical protein
MLTKFRHLTMAWTLCGACLTGCVTEAQTILSSEGEGNKVLLIARVVTVITGERARKFEPTVREVELAEQDAGTRYRITVGGNDTLFAVFLPPGRYDMTRVEINEGPFLSIAQPAVSVSLEGGPVIYGGIWRFGVDSPRYGRMVSMSMQMDEESRALFERKIQVDYPTLTSAPITTVLPLPTEFQTRLYEVAPYPRVPRYCRRRYW